MSKGDAKKWRDIGDVGTVGIEFVLSLAFGYYVGQWLDRRFFGDRGVVTLLGALFGMLAAFKAIYEAARRSQRRLEELEREEQQEREQQALHPKETSKPASHSSTSTARDQQGDASHERSEP